MSFSIKFGCHFSRENVILNWKKTKLVVNPDGLGALSDLKLFADGPLRFRAIHLWCPPGWQKQGHAGHVVPWTYRPKVGLIDLRKRKKKRAKKKGKNRKEGKKE